MSLPALAPASAPAAPDGRSAEILGRVRAAFAEKGFDGASMQDLARAAGMSVGNFYRYFPSKAAIVEGMIRLDLAEIEASFAAIMQSEAPLDSLRATLQDRVTGNCAADGRLWAEITAAALRKPDIGAVAGQMEDEITRYMVTVFGRLAGLPAAEAAARFHAHATLIVMLVKAAAMHSARDDSAHQGDAATDDRRADLTNLILRTIDRTLGEIVASVAKG